MTKRIFISISKSKFWLGLSKLNIYFKFWTHEFKRCHNHVAIVVDKLQHVVGVFQPVWNSFITISFIKSLDILLRKSP